MDQKKTNMMLIGVGGGGCQIVSDAVHSHGGALPAIGFDTDALACRIITNMRCMIIGAQRFDGLGTGGDITKGRQAIEDDEAAIIDALGGVRLAVVVASLGGGVGSGATPSLLKLLKNLGAHTICIATMPFALEGEQRQRQAERMLPILDEDSDALVVMPLDSLYSEASDNIILTDAIPRAKSSLSASITLLWNLLHSPGFISIDTQDILTLVSRNEGRCRFARACADTETRANAVVTELCRSPLLGKNPGLKNVQAAMVGVLAGGDLKLTELGVISDGLRAALSPQCEIRLGTVLDPRYEGTIQLAVIFFDSWKTALTESAHETLDEPHTEFGNERKNGRRRGQRKAGARRGLVRFRDIEATIIDGEDLDLPTYQRQGLLLDR